MQQTQQVAVQQAQKVSSTNGATGNFPEKKFRAGGISATVWLNKGHKPNGEVSEYRTIAVERSYTDKDGKWQSTNSLRVNDLPKLQLLAAKAYEYLVFKEQELFQGGV